MADEKWDQIHHPSAQWKSAGLPPVARLDVPRILKPVCPDHCSGRHETDSIVVCDRCGGQMYQVILHEYAHQEGHHFQSLKPLNGAPEHDKDQPPVCCGQTMNRRFIP